MSHIPRVAAALCCFMWLATPALAQRAVRASSAWAAVPAAGATETRAFVVVDNGTMYDVYVVGGETDAAATVELREGDNAGTFTPVKEATVPSFGQLEMSPTGIHLVLGGLKRPLKAGDTVTLSLFLDAGDPLVIDAVVK